MNGTSLIRRINDPFADFVDHFVDRSLFKPWLGRGEDVAERNWVPAVDLRQNDDAYSVAVDLPGLKRSDVHVTVENDTLTISGERSFDSSENNASYSRVERAFGKFSRSFSLPGNVDRDKVKATFNDGVLTVNIPKLEQAKSRQIEIK